MRQKLPILALCLFCFVFGWFAQNWTAPTEVKAASSKIYIPLFGIGAEAACSTLGTGWIQEVADTATGNAMAPITSVATDTMAPITSINTAAWNDATSYSPFSMSNVNSSRNGTSGSPYQAEVQASVDSGNAISGTFSFTSNTHATGGSTSSITYATGASATSYTLHYKLCSRLSTAKTYAPIFGIGATAACSTLGSGWVQEVADTATGNAMAPITSLSTASISPITSISTAAWNTMTAFSEIYWSGGTGTMRNTTGGTHFDNQNTASATFASKTYATGGSTTTYTPISGGSTTSYTMHFKVCSRV